VDSTALTDEQMKLIGKIVAENTLTTEFEYLCGRINSHGHTEANPLPGKSVWNGGYEQYMPYYVQTTLSAPDQAFARDTTRIVYLKQFTEAVGWDPGPPPQWRSRVAMIIDLRGLPDGTPINADLALLVQNIGLIVAYPTN
jgi:hypothetical protein